MAASALWAAYQLNPKLKHLERTELYWHLSRSIPVSTHVFEQRLANLGSISYHSWANSSASRGALLGRYEWLQSRPPQPKNTGFKRTDVLRAFLRTGKISQGLTR